MTARVVVALICVTHQSDSFLDRFTDALAEGLEGCPSRVVFVDSGSTDAGPARIQRLVPDGELLRLPSNRGFAAGINAAVAHVRRTGGADVYVVVNPDVRLGRHCITHLVQELRAPGVGIAVPRLSDEHGALLYSLRNPPTVVSTWAQAVLGGGLAARLRLPGEVIRDGAAYSGRTAASWATGGLLAISEQCSSEVGEWDESFFLYEEEVDFCLRAGDAGYQLLYVPWAEAVRHIGPRRPSPWAHALMRVNRWRHLSARRQDGATAVRCGMLLADALRLLGGRPEAGAGLWALWHRATPAQVVARYRRAGRDVALAEGDRGTTVG